MKTEEGAFIFIKVAMGKNDERLEAPKKISEVDVIYVLVGDFDFLLHIKNKILPARRRSATSAAQAQNCQDLWENKTGAPQGRNLCIHAQQKGVLNAAPGTIVWGRIDHKIRPFYFYRH